MGVIGGMAGGEILRSIFGGPVSTRAICAVAAPRDEQEPQVTAGKQRAKQQQGNGVGGALGKPAVSLPKPKPIDPKVLRQKQLQADLDAFEDLASDGPSKPSKPKPKPVDHDAAAGPGPGSSKLNGAKHPSLARQAGGSSPAQGARGAGTGTQRPKSAAPGSGAARLGSAAKPGVPRTGVQQPPAPATNGTGSRAAPTNHQRQGTAGGLSAGTKQLPAGAGKPMAADPRHGTNAPSGSGRPTPGGAQGTARPAGTSQQQLQRPGTSLLARPGGPAAGSGAGRGGTVGAGAGARPGSSMGVRRDGACPGLSHPHQQQQRRPGGPGPVRPGGVRRRRDEEDEYEDDFVVDDDDEDGQDWRKFLRRTTGYDPSRFRDDHFDDRMMEASWRQVVAEEKRSERMGRREDELAEEEEERRRKEKNKKLKQATKKQRMD